MTRRPLSFALVPMLLGTQLAAAQAQTPAATQPSRAPAQATVPAEAPAVTFPADPVEAREVRERLHELLRQ